MWWCSIWYEWTWCSVLILAVLILILGIQMKVLTFWNSGYDLWSTLLVSFEFPGFCACPPCLACPSCLLLASGLWWQLWYLFWLWYQRDGFSGGKNAKTSVLFTQFALKEQNYRGKFLYLLFLWILWTWWRVSCSLWGLCYWMLASLCHLTFLQSSAPSLSYLVYCHNLWCLSLRSCPGLLFWV